MTYQVGDDATIIFPVTDTAVPPGTLNFTPTVSARRTLGETTTITGTWLGSPGPQRDLEIPLGDLPAGLWELTLVIDGGEDVTLGWVNIASPVYSPTDPGEPSGPVAWSEITGKPSTFPPAAHTHDDRYYTQAEVDALLADLPTGGGGISDGLTVVNGGTVDLDDTLPVGSLPGYLVTTTTTFSGEGGESVLEPGVYTLLRIADGWTIYEASGGLTLGVLPDTTPPSAITDLAATGGENALSGTWSASADAESDVHYRYRYYLTSAGNSGVAWTNTDATSFGPLTVDSGAYTVEAYSYSTGGSTVPDTATAVVTAPDQWVTIMEDSFTRTTDGNIGGTLPDTVGTDAWVGGGTSPVSLAGTWRQPNGTSGSGYMPHAKPAGATKFRATIDLHIQAQGNSLSPKIDLELFTLPTIKVAIGNSGPEVSVRGQNPSQVTVDLAGPWTVTADSVVTVEREGMTVTFKNGATALGTLDLNTARDIYANVGDPFATMISTEFMENSYLRSVKIEAYQ